MRQRRGRGHADHRDLAAGPVDPDRRMDVIVPVQDQFDAMRCNSASNRPESVSRLKRESERSG